MSLGGNRLRWFVEPPIELLGGLLNDGGSGMNFVVIVRTSEWRSAITHPPSSESVIVARSGRNKLATMVIAPTTPKRISHHSPIMLSSAIPTTHMATARLMMKVAAARP